MLSLLSTACSSASGFSCSSICHEASDVCASVSRLVASELRRRGVPTACQPELQPDADSLLRASMGSWLLSGGEVSAAAPSSCLIVASVALCEACCDQLLSADFPSQPHSRGRQADTSSLPSQRFRLMSAAASATPAPATSRSTLIPGVCCAAWVLLEWQLSCSRLAAVLPSLSQLYCQLSQAAAELPSSALQPPPSAAPFAWDRALSASVLPLLQLPDSNLPPLPGLPMPGSAHGEQGDGHWTARLAAAHTADGTSHKMSAPASASASAYDPRTAADGALLLCSALLCSALLLSCPLPPLSLDVVLLPVELLLLEAVDEAAEEDAAFLRECESWAKSGQKAGEDEPAAAEQSSSSPVFSHEWAVFELQSLLRLLRCVSALSRAFVLDARAGSGRSVFVSDSELGRRTAEFLLRHTAFAFAPLPLSLQSAARAVARLSALPCGHRAFVIGPLSLLAPVCLQLINGGSAATTDTIVPKQELRLLFRRQPFVHITAWDPNPLLSHLQPAQDGSEGGSAMSSLALLSWTLSAVEAEEAELSEEQRSLQRLSRQRTFVHGSRRSSTRLPLLTAYTAAASQSMSAPAAPQACCCGCCLCRLSTLCSPASAKAFSLLSP